jgi:hypothetical protein
MLDEPDQVNGRREPGNPGASGCRTREEVSRLRPVRENRIKQDSYSMGRGEVPERVRDTEWQSLMPQNRSRQSGPTTGW